MLSDLSNSQSDITMPVPETAIEKKMGTSSEPANDDAQPSPPKEVDFTV